MKIHEFPLRTRKYREAKTYREPLYTLPEIADRLGVDYDTLRGYIRGKRKAGYPPPPAPVMLTGGSSNIRMRTLMYRLSEYKAWWTLRIEASNKETS